MDIEKIRSNLEKHGFRTYFVDDRVQALALVKELTQEDKTFSHGGSMTLIECGILEFLKTKGEDYYDRDRTLKEQGFDAYFDVMRRANTVDVFLSSSNAITENGYLYNVDGNGNRISCLMFGPKKVIILAGVNKIVKDEEAAIKRVKEIAQPRNAKRLQLTTPCTITGKCEECSHPRRICNIYVFQKRSAIPGRIHIVLINEVLGF